MSANLTTIIGGAAAIMVLCLFGAIIAGIWQFAGEAAAQGDDPTGKENLP